MVKKASGIILLHLLSSTLCIPLNEFYPFGGNTADSNQRLGDGNNFTSGAITTDQLYYFYGQFEFIITVSYLHSYQHENTGLMCKNLRTSLNFKSSKYKHIRRIF